MSVARLDYELRAAGVPIDGVAGGPPPAPVPVDYAAAATPAQVAQGEAVVAAFDWSQSAQDAWRTARRRQRAKDLLDADAGAVAQLVRAVLLAVGDEVNLLRGLHGLTLRTSEQVRQAIRDKLDAGAAD